MANIAAGSNNSLDMRIDTMMEMVGDDPVMWPTVRTIAPADGYYDETEMQKMTEALVKATKKYPNLYVYDWGNRIKTSGIRETAFTSLLPAISGAERFSLVLLLRRSLPRGSHLRITCLRYLSR